MSDVKDLYLAYKFTDRDGNDVYDIKQELLHVKNTQDGPRFNTIGELRVVPGRDCHACVTLRWYNQDRQQVERHDTG